MNRVLKHMRTLCRTVVESAGRNGQGACVVAVDLEGRTVVSLRTDTTPYLAADPARGKALAALMLRMPTDKAGGMIDSDPMIARAMASMKDAVFVPGGMPVMLNGAMVGAIGVAGGHYKGDHALCEAAVNGAGS